MAVVPRLDETVEVKFYGVNAVSSHTAAARRESLEVVYEPRGGLGRTLTRVNRATFLMRVNQDMEDHLRAAPVQAPLRMLYRGVEYYVTTITSTPRKDRVLVSVQSFSGSEP